jgi:hypothetical protein
MYLNGKSIKEDPAEALKLYRMAAEQGDTGAMAGLGRLYAAPAGRYQGWSADPVQSYIWFALAAEVIKTDSTLSETRRSQDVRDNEIFRDSAKEQLVHDQIVRADEFVKNWLARKRN